MAQGDFGVVPNVWRPQFVPPINTGEDTQAGIPGNSAANLGATTTTIEESFFSVPIVGWQKIASTVIVPILTSVAYIRIADFRLYTNTSRTLIIIQYKGGAALAGLSLRFSANSPYTGTFGAATSTSGNNQVGFYSVLLSPMANLTYQVAAAHTLARVFASFSYDTGIMADLTAFNNQVFGQTSFTLPAVNDGAGTDQSFATGLAGDIDTSIPLTLEGKVTAGTANITAVGVWKLGDSIAALSV